MATVNTIIHTAVDGLVSSMELSKSPSILLILTSSTWSAVSGTFNVASLSEDLSIDVDDMARTLWLREVQGGWNEHGHNMDVAVLEVYQGGCNSLP